MSADWLEMPAGPGATRWHTAPVQRLVLAVCHTVASTQHVLDAVGLAEADERVQVVFTRAPDVLSNGTDELLASLGAVVIPWEQARRSTFDLALAADCAGLHDLRAPIVQLPHGIMSNKVTWSPSGGPGDGLVTGLAAPWLTSYGRLIPRVVTLSHEAARDVLARQCPQALPAARLTGDLCLDRLTASLPRRTTYRRGLGVGADRTLIAVSSTWGEWSLFRRAWPALRETLRELPRDRYAVRAVCHPAAWHGHGARQVEAWGRNGRVPGLRYVEPLHWRALAAAADVWIGDYGSPTLYAATVGIPVLYLPAPDGRVAPGSAAEALARATALLDAGRALPEQLRRAERRREAVAAAVPPLVSSVPGEAPGRLRAEMYRLLRLPEPAGRAVARPVAVSRPYRRRVVS
ncbi:hypothetical protein J2S43_002289 [Catenuloplanes nepalensis]|uniref:Uncharacterized protein n=1 Tax=Catenuloplanes nepalensis TaxID=587533 RepID=A0ABT9MQS8_9ACTN|nr:hypothetical protein [Catenuloplanes nepalensis]MDP9793777.1 hypothetical protein [Catenuloplanes nepalensis]